MGAGPPFARPDLRLPHPLRFSKGGYLDSRRHEGFALAHLQLRALRVQQHWPRARREHTTVGVVSGIPHDAYSRGFPPFENREGMGQPRFV